jgi:hypothetical protein
VIIIIPGNPGIPDFYHKFSKELFQHLKIPVIVVGYLGHSFEHPTTQIFSIHEQLEHKYAFIQFLIKKNQKISIHLAAHSVGSWISLEIVGRGDSQIKNFFGLFPTISYLNLSENGQSLFMRTSSKKEMRNIFAWIAHSAAYLPKFLRYWISKLVKSQTELESYIVESLMNHDIVNNVLFLADTEFRDIGEANYEIIDQNKSKIQFYYGNPDHWVPIGFNQEMKVKYPENVTIDQENNKHGFVVEKKGVNAMVNFIKKHLK